MMQNLGYLKYPLSVRGEANIKNEKKAIEIYRTLEWLKDIFLVMFLIMLLIYY